MQGSINLSPAGGVIVSNTQPLNTSVLWVDTGSGGTAKYYDPSTNTWKPVATAWQ